MKSMYKEFMENDLGILNGRLSGDIYGYKDVFIKIFENELATACSKEIYEYLIQEVTCRNGSLIPSRNEKTSIQDKWGIVSKNFTPLRGLAPEEKPFLGPSGPQGDSEKVWRGAHRDF